ncbi:type 4 prepilin-like proteins leader peptide-processing enzyme [bacterium BMS3Abin05]|nr:type 4 prepilin-like proteins leader peptide-processing enzyme [bacterium BMS3Abin05]HDL78748.1 prepilin peptidase [Bacteroidota bacterium]
MNFTAGIILFFFFGLIFGSFLNVCIYRIPKGESIIWPVSHCPKCGTPIKPIDNIPVLSYALLGGKCRFCKTRISFRYPLVELLTGVLFAGLFLKFGLSSETLVFSILGLLLITISFIDIDYRLILNKVTLPGILLGAVLTVAFRVLSYKQVLLGFAIGGGGLLFVAFLGSLLFRKESMGMGDIKLAAMIGVFLGVKGTAFSLLVAFFIAALFSAGAMALEKADRHSQIPFGPFIALATFVYLFWGEQMIHWYLQLIL